MNEVATLVILYLSKCHYSIPDATKHHIVGAIVKNNITCKGMYGNPKTWIWQPLRPKTFQNDHIELCLLLYNISEGSYTPKKPVTMKLSKIRGKTAENSKNRRIQLKYRKGGFGNTFIRFPALEYGILKKNVSF